MTSASQHGATLESAPTSTEHALPTRAVHAGLAIAIVVQLASSLIMNPKGAGNVAFEVHEYSGLAAFSLVLGFWLLAVLRRRGTPLARLFPWFSGSGRALVGADIKTYLSAAAKLRLPPHDGDTALVSAVHGLGLLLMTGMAASGTAFYVVNTGNPDAGGLVGAAMLVHKALANLVWAYLIGHAGMALLAHYVGTLSIGTMWSFKGRPPRS